MLYTKGQRSKGLFVIMPNSDLDRQASVSKVQGFFDPVQKTIGLWLLSGQGKVLGEFNPTGLAQPTG